MALIEFVASPGCARHDLDFDFKTVMQKGNGHDAASRACLAEPLIALTEWERDGYVPNAAYSCGEMIHNRQLYIPFLTSDMTTRFAIVSADSLLDRLRQ